MDIEGRRQREDDFNFEAQYLGYLVQVYKEQLERVHHLDRMVLIVFAIIIPLIFALFALHGLGIVKTEWGGLPVMLVALALAAAGAHVTIANASDYWITFYVVAQMTRGLQLVQRGLFPPSVLVGPPTRFWPFCYRLLGGFRGAFMLMYLSIGWLSLFLAMQQWLGASLKFGLAFLPAFILAFGSAIFCYQRVRARVVPLRRVEEIVEADRQELVNRHCDLAEALLRLDPPRTYFAEKQYELALQMDPENMRAKQGLQRLTRWTRKD